MLRHDAVLKVDDAANRKPSRDVSPSKDDQQA